MNSFGFCLIILFCYAWGCTDMDTSNTESRPQHHTDAAFRNPDQNEERGFADVLKWQFGGGPADRTGLLVDKDAVYQPDYATPSLAPAHNDASALSITWIGHATFLIQIGGFNILTDPVFSERCSPVSFAGPKRHARPGLDFDDLPDIDAVVISHNHYDHLDTESIRSLGGGKQYFTPLGLAEWFADLDIHDVREMDWWQQSSVGDVVLHCVPAQHFSGRTLWDRDKTLWCGWVIETRHGNIFFAGDTGYSNDFKEIGRRFGPIVAAMIPIGAYRPRWFMGPVHVSPDEAVQIHIDVMARKSIGMHWGTFDLADEPLAEPPVYLQHAVRAAGLQSDEFVVMRFGESLKIDPANRPKQDSE